MTQKICLVDFWKTVSLKIFSEWCPFLKTKKVVSSLFVCKNWERKGPKRGGNLVNITTLFLFLFFPLFLRSLSLSHSMWDSSLLIEQMLMSPFLSHRIAASFSSPLTQTSPPLVQAAIDVSATFSDLLLCLLVPFHVAVVISSVDSKAIRYTDEPICFCFCLYLCFFLLLLFELWRCVSLAVPFVSIFDLFFFSN